MPEHFQISPSCHTTLASIAQLTIASTGLNVTGHHAGKPVSAVFGQDSNADSELYRSVDGFASAKELNPTPKTMESHHVAAGKPTRVGQCRAPGGEESSLGRVFAGPAGVDAVSVLGDGECAGPIAGAAERQREVGAPYRFSHHTADGLAVYVDEPEVMHRIPAGPESETTSALPDCLAIPTAPDAAFLSMVLRDPTMWPAGFEWDFHCCEKCGLGLAQRLWLQMQDEGPYDVGASFGIDRVTVYAVFGAGLSDRLGKDNMDITPADVADALDAAIASQVSA